MGIYRNGGFTYAKLVEREWQQDGMGWVGERVDEVGWKGW
jgi:hypothetical protein